LDGENRPIQGVLVSLKIGADEIASAQSDDQGRITLTNLKPAHYEIQASKEGFGTGREPDLNLAQGAVSPLDLFLILSAARQDSAARNSNSRRPKLTADFDFVF
jgi:Carboxypeptidase regulatory-like domain